MKKIESHPARSIGFLSRLSDGELSMAERAEFDLHRRGCPECAAAAEEFEEVLALYRSAEPAPVDPGLASRITRRIDRELRRPEPARFIPVKIDLVWASVVIVALAGAIVTYSLVKPPSRRQETVIAEKKTAPAAPAFAPQAPPEEPRDAVTPSPNLQRETARRAAAGSIAKPPAPPAPAQPTTATSEAETRAGRLDEERSRQARSAEKTETLADNAAAGGAAAPAPPAETPAAPVAAMAAPAPALEKAAPAPGMLARKEAKQAGEEQPIHVGPVTSPELLKRVEPNWPEDLRRHWHYPGTLVFEVKISPTGDVIDVKPRKEIDPRYERPVIDALRQWKYKPATENGKPVAVYLTVTVSIDLR